MFNNVRDARKNFFVTYEKMQQGGALTDLEKQLAELIAMHPEYNKYFSDEKYLDYSFDPRLETANPFMHISMHQAVREQLSTDRPQGIVAIFADLIAKFGDAHEVEHRIAEQLAQMMHDIMQNGQPYEDSEYLRRLKKL